MDKRVTSSGSKAYQRDDAENRIIPYYNWHRTLDRSLLMLDVDAIEWRFRNQQLVAVGVMEITRVDVGKMVNEAYLQAIIQRFEERDLQARVARTIADALNTQAYIILFRQDCSEFWVYDLSQRAGWRHFTPSEMEDFLRSL